MLDRLSFLIGEALQGLRRHGLMTFAAVSTVAVALYLIGGLGYVYVQIDRTVAQISNRFEIQAYFKDDTTQAQISTTAQAIRKLDGVKSAVWIPKAHAWRREQERNPEITRGLENPFPDALKITLSDISKLESIADSVQSMERIEPEGVMYHDPMQRFLNDMLRLIRWLGALLGGLLFITAGILIYNAIRLTLDARKREIRIMQLVGATYLTVRVPFLIEGAVQGALGGALATGLLWATYASVQTYVQSNMSALNQMGVFPLGWMGSMLVAAGALYGVGCSVIAIRRPASMRGPAI